MGSVTLRANIRKLATENLAGEGVLGTDDVLFLLGVSRATFWRMRKDGRFPSGHKTLAGRIKNEWLEDDVVEFLSGPVDQDQVDAAPGGRATEVATGFVWVVKIHGSVYAVKVSERAARETLSRIISKRDPGIWEAPPWIEVWPLGAEGCGRNVPHLYDEGYQAKMDRLERCEVGHLPRRGVDDQGKR